MCWLINTNMFEVWHVFHNPTNTDDNYTVHMYTIISLLYISYSYTQIYIRTYIYTSSYVYSIYHPVNRYLPRLE